MQRSKNYKKSAELFDQDKLYTPLEAVKLAKDTSKVKFDATVEVAMRPRSRAPSGAMKPKRSAHPGASAISSGRDGGQASRSPTMSA